MGDSAETKQSNHPTAPNFIPTVVTFTSCLLLGITLIAYFNRWVGMAELAVSFRPYYLFPALILLIIALVLRQRKIILLLVLVLLLNGWEVGQVYRFRPNPITTSTSSSNLRILHINVDRQVLPWVGTEQVVALLKNHQPTIAVLIEVGRPQALEIEQTLNTQYPYTATHFDAETDGVLVLSTVEITDSETITLGLGRQLPAVNFLQDGAAFQLIAPHPTNAIYGLDERNSQLAAVADYAQKSALPLIISGDLNVTLWSDWYQAIERAGMQNVRQGFGILPTWRPRLRTPIPLVTLPIDHILVSPHFQTQAVFVGEPLQSDHLPLIADLLFE